MHRAEPDQGDSIRRFRIILPIDETSGLNSYSIGAIASVQYWGQLGRIHASRPGGTVLDFYTALEMIAKYALYSGS